MQRFAETFFRYWVIALVPLIVLPAVSLVMILHTPKNLLVTANLWVDQSATTALSNYNTFLSPAQNEAAALDQLVQSPSFDLSVIRGSTLYKQNLAMAADPGTAAADDLTRNLRSTSKGDNLLSISYACKNAQLGVEVLESLLTVARQQPVILSQLQTTNSMEYYTYQLHAAQERRSLAMAKVTTYMNAHGIDPKQLTSAQIIDPALGDLYQQFQNDQADVTNIQQQLSKLRLQSQVPASLAEQSAFRVIDAPHVAIVSSNKQKVMNLAIAAVIGLLLSGGFIVVKTALDRSLRYPSEVVTLLDLPVLAVVPYSPTLPQPERKTAVARKPGSRPGRLERVS